MKSMFLPALSFVALLASFACTTGPAADCTKAPKYGDLNLTSCTSCHSPAGGSPRGINYNTYNAASSNADDGLEQMNSGRMPPSGSPAMSASDQAAFTTWVTCGTPQ